MGYLCPILFSQQIWQAIVVRIGPLTPLQRLLMIHLDPLDTIKFSLPEGEKMALKRACFVDDTTMAQFLRRSIRAYLKDHPDPKVQELAFKSDLVRSGSI